MNANANMPVAAITAPNGLMLEYKANSSQFGAFVMLVNCIYCKSAPVATTSISAVSVSASLFLFFI